MNFKLFGFISREMIRWIYSAEKEDFIEVFGSAHLWSKYHDTYDWDEGLLICNMDLDNLEKPAKAAMEKSGLEYFEQEVRLIEGLKQFALEKENQKRE